jgi:diguanylate cyclase (GGDEF)-like protein
MSTVVDHLAELTGYRDRDVLDVTLVAALRDLLKPHGVAIYRCVGDSAQQRWFTRARQHAEDLTPTADPLWSELESLPALDDFPLRAACLRSGQPSRRAGQGGASTLSVFPVRSEIEVVGVLELDTAEALTPEQMALVLGILKVYRNFQGLLDYSERDTLTGLLNRKTFDDTFLRSAAALQAARPGDDGLQSERREGHASQVWLAVLDIDHFKRVNDDFGHLIGDEVLLLVSRLMRSCLRTHDQIYRFGGEEFVILLRTRGDASVNAALERLRSTVHGYDFPQIGRITVSVGYCDVRQGDTPTNAFERADKCVYHAKQNGRNRVVSHAELVAKGVVADCDRVSNIELF